MSWTHLLFPASLLALALPAALQAEDSARTITVQGEGTASAAPDMATVTTGVTTVAETAATALRDNNSATSRLLDVLTSAGVESRDVQTSSFNVNPEFRHDDRRRSEPEIIGYRVSNQLTVRIRDLDSLGEILDTLVQEGSNQISGIEFDISDKRELLEKARRGAVEDARQRAETYASAAGVSVGSPLKIEETERGPSPPYPMARMAMAESSVPVAAGEKELTVTISMQFELLQSDEDNGGR